LLKWKVQTEEKERIQSKLSINLKFKLNYRVILLPDSPVGHAFLLINRIFVPAMQTEKCLFGIGKQEDSTQNFKLTIRLRNFQHISYSITI